MRHDDIHIHHAFRQTRVEFFKKLMTDTAHHSQHSGTVHVEQVIFGIVIWEARMKTRAAAHDGGEIRAIAIRLEMRVMDHGWIARLRSRNNNRRRRIPNQ